MLCYVLFVCLLIIALTFKSIKKDDDDDDDDDMMITCTNNFGTFSSSNVFKLNERTSLLPRRR